MFRFNCTYSIYHWAFSLEDFVHRKDGTTRHQYRTWKDVYGGFMPNHVGVTWICDFLMVGKNPKAKKFAGVDSAKSS